MEQPSPAVVKKIQALAKLAADLRQGQHFNITRLTVIKSLCSDPNAAAKFVRRKVRRCSSWHQC